MKKILLAVGIVLILGGVYYFMSDAPESIETVSAKDHKNATYLVEGQSVTLINGHAEIPNGSTTIKIDYFGNDFKYDLDKDGREDVVFLVTRQPGGSGTFYYVVAALNKEEGYVGMRDSYLLGDRIAPQTIHLSPKPEHKDVIVVAYADRAPGESFATQPSVGKSVLLKFDSASGLFGIVADIPKEVR